MVIVTIYHKTLVIEFGELLLLLRQAILKNYCVCNTILAVGEGQGDWFKLLSKSGL